MPATPKLRALNIATSLDGYMAGPDQDLDNPLGVGGRRLHEWALATPFFRTTMKGETVDPDEPLDEGEAIDQSFVVRGDENIGANILGRNMFGPVRGEWGDSDWKGWWGPEPSHHNPVFVLTHHARDPIEMAGGTTFHFVTDGIESALEQAFAAAGGADVRLGGGASTIQQYLRAGLLDELHIAYVPILMGQGERVFGDVDAAALGYECIELKPSTAVVHARFERKG
jgi:dihydrofolate reductase